MGRRASQTGRGRFLKPLHAKLKKCCAPGSKTRLSLDWLHDNIFSSAKSRRSINAFNQSSLLGCRRASVKTPSIETCERKGGRERERDRVSDKFISGGVQPRRSLFYSVIEDHHFWGSYVIPPPNLRDSSMDDCSCLSMLAALGLPLSHGYRELMCGARFDPWLLAHDQNLELGTLTCDETEQLPLSAK